MWGGGGGQAPGRNNIIYGQEHLKKLEKEKSFKNWGNVKANLKTSKIKA